MNLGLENKKVTITAGSSGIGLAIAEGFVKEGATVTVCSREAEKVNYENNILAVNCDLSDEKSVEEFSDKIIENGGTDILVLNSGGPTAGNFFDVSLQDWDYGYNMLIRSNLIILNKLLPVMIEKKFGRVIFMTSISTEKPLNNLIISNSLRRGVEGLAKSLSVEFSKYGITFNCVGPGYTLTDRLTALADKIAGETGETPENVYDLWKKSTTTETLAQPDDIASVVLFLASEKAHYITGRSIMVDGGFLLK